MSGLMVTLGCFCPCPPRPRPGNLGTSATSGTSGTAGTPGIGSFGSFTGIFNKFPRTSLHRLPVTLSAIPPHKPIWQNLQKYKLSELIMYTTIKEPISNYYILVSNKVLPEIFVYFYFIINLQILSTVFVGKWDKWSNLGVIFLFYRLQIMCEFGYEPYKGVPDSPVSVGHGPGQRRAARVQRLEYVGQLVSVRRPTCLMYLVSIVCKNIFLNK